MVVVPHLTLTVFVPVVDHPALRVPHVQNTVAVIEDLLVFLRVNIQRAVDHLERILFVRAPKPPLFHPDRVKIRTPDHQVFRLLDDEFGINFDCPAFSRPRCNHQEINHL